MNSKIIIATLFVLLLNKSAQAQHYFYTHLKIPLFEYLSKSNKERPDKNTDGIALNAGYAIQLIPNFYLETGIDYLLGNSLTNKSYTDNTLTELKSETSLSNQAFSFQIRPTYKISIDEDDETYLALACGLNYQKLYTDASFTMYAKNSHNQTSTQEKQATAKSNFYLALEPKLALEFKTEKKIAYRFGFNYTRINWDRTIQKLNFNDVAYQQPKHKTSTIFFFGGFVF